MCKGTVKYQSYTSGSNRDLVYLVTASDTDLLNEQAILREFLDTVNIDSEQCI